MSGNCRQSLNLVLRMIEPNTGDASEMPLTRVLRVLVADDDADIREFVETVLADEQFSASFAADGEQALRLLQTQEFDLLLTDIRMPGMTGFELVRRARAIRPELRVLFMSGFASEYKIDPRRDDFVPKPFRPRELLGCIFEIMGRGGVRHDRGEGDRSDT
jgi:CheY-like chemotaxis protein